MHQGFLLVLIGWTDISAPGNRKEVHTSLQKKTFKSITAETNYFMNINSDKLLLDILEVHDVITTITSHVISTHH